ncbi:MAG: long-chain fatty acid--CoA ligase [Desulfobacteraceae bacterium]|nr:long-chain fatty acid--CoA ligase [Desulfobacteraceae bacterium]
MENIWHKSYDPDVPRFTEYPETTLPRILEQNARKVPHNIALEFFGRKITYIRLWEDVLRMANGLKDLGVREGTRIAIMLPNCPQCVIAYYASLWLGAVVTMTNPLYVERELHHHWSDSEVEFLFVLDHLYPRAAKVAPETSIRKIVTTSIREYLPFPLKMLYPLKARFKRLFTAVPFDGAGILDFARLIGENEPLPVPCGATPDGVALLQYTGGTTGTAKGAMLTHRNVVANVRQLVCWFPVLQQGRERFLAVLPFFHVFGLTVSLNLATYTGSAVIIMPRFDPDQLIKTIEKTKPTIFPGVPAIYTALMAHPRIDSFDLSSIRFCVTGSAPMPVEVLRKFEKKTGSIIVEGYGLSECSPVTHVNPIHGVRKPGSIGIPLPDTLARIVDAQTGSKEMPPGEVGELVVRGPQVMRGYWKRDQENLETIRDGWLHTGDLATMDENGYFFIVDRKKDLIISRGYNIYPREVEEVLYEHPAIHDAAAIGVPDAKRGEAVKVFIVPATGASLGEEEILRWCRERLAPYKVPKTIEIRESLPKTLVGKVLRRELRNG